MKLGIVKRTALFALVCLTLAFGSCTAVFSAESVDSTSSFVSEELETSTDDTLSEDAMNSDSESSDGTEEGDDNSSSSEETGGFDEGESGSVDGEVTSDVEFPEVTLP